MEHKTYHGRPVIWSPQPRQAAFMARTEDEALYGGAAGGGKSDALIIEALRQVHIPHYRALILRKTYPQLSELIDKTMRYYKPVFPKARYNGSSHCWTFPSGAKIYFGSLNHTQDKYNYQGKAFDFIGVDELTHFTWDEYSYVMSRNRPSGPGTRVYIRATANPGGVGHGWVKARFISPAPAGTRMVQMVKDIVKTSTIMSYIGTGVNRLSEIAARCNEPATNLSRPLKKLVDLGFLAKDVPFGIDEKNAKKSLYKIADPFMAFYYQFVVPNRSFIELGRRLPIEQALTAHFSEYVSMQWEKLCRDAVTGNLINRVVYGKAKRWWGSVINEDKKTEQVEFDVMAESLDKKYLLVGECKWTTQENGKQLTAALLRKANLLPFAQNYTIVPVLFLKNTPKDDAGNAMLSKDVVELIR